MTDRSYPHAGKALIKRYSKLQQKKYRDREGLFLAEGLRTVRELLHHIPDEDSLTALFVEPEQLQNLVPGECVKNRIFITTPDESSRLSGTSTAQGVVGVFRKPEITRDALSAEGGSFVIALDDVQDPGNVGTILRTAAWFGISALICGPGTVDIYNPKAIRASAGSVFGVDHYGVDNLYAELKKMQQRDYTICCSSLEGNDFRAYHAWPEKIVLVIGNEANGIGRDIMQLADRHVAIPRGKAEQGVESLNAAVSAAILMAMLRL